MSRKTTKAPPPDASVTSPKGLSAEANELLRSTELADFVEAEIKFRVNEELQRMRLQQAGLLGIILLVACIGLAFTVNAYQKLKDTKTKSDQVALVMAQFEAVLKASGTVEKGSGGE